ncbi:MAG: FAD/NAD(P)-binding protein, partial [Rhodanobacter sp.]
IGMLPARPLAGIEQSLRDSGHYITDPWPWLAANTTPAPREAVLIGLGLTAADMALELAERWPHTRFTAVSRHGHWPEAHLPTVAVPDGDGADLAEAMHNHPSVRYWLRLLRETTATTRDWRPVIDSLRPRTPDLWRELDVEQRQRFLRHARWAWERVRHRMAPATASKLNAWEQQGRLRRWRGRIHGATLVDDRVQLNLAAHSGQPARQLDTDLVIQTTGIEHDVSRTHHPLVRQLVTNQHVLPDPLGLGWQSSDHGHLLQSDGAQWPHLFAIGSLLRGTLWESTAMPEIRQQARRIAAQLLAD